MVQTVPANKVELHELKANFGLQLAEKDTFFPEWSEGLPEISDAEKQALDRIKKNYLYLLDYPIMESIVKMIVLSPLLDLAGFYAPPFRVEGERNVSVSAVDEGETIRGSIDVVILHNQLTVTVIEAKNSTFSINTAMPQALAYMLAESSAEKPKYGLVLNGSEFLFLKMIQEDFAYYDTSNIFSLINKGNDLYLVLRILKRIKDVVAESAVTKKQ